MKKIYLLVLALFLFACEGGLKQDPLAGQPTNIRDATYEKPKTEVPPCSVDSLIIDTFPEVFNFTEGFKGEITLKGRILDCGDEFNIEIQNMPTGATFDSASGVFSWTPNDKTVLGNNFFQSFPLRVLMYTNRTPVISIDRTYNLWIHRNTAIKPQILSSSKNNIEITESDRLFIEVSVFDPESEDITAGQIYPQIRVVPLVNDFRDGSSYVKLAFPVEPRQDTKDPRVWHYRLLIDFDQKDIVDRNVEMRYGLVAYSRFGVASDVVKQTFKVINKVRPAMLSWDESNKYKTEFLVGEKNIFSFKVFDAKNEGFVSVPNFKKTCQTLSKEASCQCLATGGRYTKDFAIYCSISWMPTSIGEYRINFDIENTNYEDATDVKKTSIDRQIVVVDPSQNPKGEK